MDEEGQLYFGGDIYTVDDARPTAEAVAVGEGKIALVEPLRGGYLDPLCGA